MNTGTDESAEPVMSLLLSSESACAESARDTLCERIFRSVEPAEPVMSLLL